MRDDTAASDQGSAAARGTTACPAQTGPQEHGFAFWNGAKPSGPSPYDISALAIEWKQRTHRSRRNNSVSAYSLFGCCVRSHTYGDCALRWAAELPRTAPSGCPTSCGMPACRIQRTGRALNQDTFYWGTLKGVGRGSRLRESGRQHLLLARIFRDHASVQGGAVSAPLQWGASDRSSISVPSRHW